MNQPTQPPTQPPAKSKGGRPITGDGAWRAHNGNPVLGLRLRAPLAAEVRARGLELLPDGSSPAEAARAYLLRLIAQDLRANPGMRSHEMTMEVLAYEQTQKDLLEAQGRGGVYGWPGLRKDGGPAVPGL